MKLFLSLLLAIFPFVLSAQTITESHTHTTTPEAHLFATFVKSFDHGLALTFEEEIRSAPSHRAHTTVALGYTPIPYLNIYAGYTLKLYGNQGWTDPNKYLQHRANVLFTGQVKLGQWNLSLREGVMLDARAGEVDKRVKNQVDFTLRSRLQAVYSIPKTPLGIVAKFEILNTLNAPVAYINSLHNSTLHNATQQPHNATQYHTINDLIDAALKIGFFSITVTTNAQQDFSWIRPQSIWVSMDGVGEYHDRVRGEGSFARLEENIRKSGFKHICVNMVVNSLNYESLDAAMEYAKNNPAIEQISINFHTPYPGTEYLMLAPEKKAELIDKVLEYKKKGYPIMNSRSGLKLMKRNALGEIKLGKECFVTNFIYTDGSRSLCLGYGTEQCRVCGFCMAGEMASVFHFKLDTILSGFKLRM